MLYQARLGPHSTATLLGMDNLVATLLAHGMETGEDTSSRIRGLLRQMMIDLDVRGHGNSPAMGSVLIKMGHLALATGDPAEAVDEFERGLVMLELPPGRDISQRLSAWSGLAEAYAQTGRIDESIALLERAFEQSQTERPHHTDTARLALQLTMRLRQAKRHDDVLVTGQRALALITKSYGPEHSLVARTLVQLGRSDMAVGHPALAAARFERALALAVEHEMRIPSQPGLRYLVAKAYHEARDTPRAQLEARAALEIWPTDDDASYGTRAELVAWAGRP